MIMGVIGILVAAAWARWRPVRTPRPDPPG